MNRSLPLWPREHGATVQILLAVGAALGVGPLGRAPLAQAGLTLLALLASVPASALLARRVPVPGAGRRLTLLATAALALAVLGWTGSPLARLVHLLLPLPPALLLAILVARGREHSPFGEQLASLTFALAAHPIGVLAGRSPWQAASLAGILAAAFLLSAVSVRTLQRPGVPGLGRPWTLVPPLFGLGLMALVEDLYRGGWIQPRLTFTLLPAVVATLAFAVHKPAKLKHVGWILAVGTLGSAGWSVFLLR